MKNTEIRTKIRIGITIPIVMLVLVAIGVYYYTNKVINNFESVTHTNEVIANVDELAKALVDMETGERGFLLSGDEKFLEPYKNGQLNFDILIAKLKIKVNDNPVQVSNLEQLENMQNKWDNEINQPEIAWRQEINQGKSSLDSLINHFNKALGKDKMDLMRLKINEIVAIERNLNIIRTNNAKKASSFLILFTIIATVFTLIVSISIGLLKGERKVRKTQKLLHSIINNSNAIIYMKDAEGKFTLVNKLFEEQFLPEKEVLGKTDYDLMPKEDADRYRKNDLQIMQKGQPMQFEESALLSDGIHTVISNKFPLFNEKNELIGICSISTDISNRKKIEQALIESEEKLKLLNADKDQFIAILAHDLKNPFISLLGFSDLLLKNLRKYDIDKIEKQLKLIHQTTHKTYNLLEDLLLWSKAQSGKLTIEPTKIIFSEICNEIIYNMQHQADTKEISINYNETEKTILSADINMFKTILRNLISNAIKFTNKKGQINIYTETNHENVTITVSDNGVGIKKDNLLKLWDFTQSISTSGTANEKGTGFGLLICKEFVEKHGGKIWVESELENLAAGKAGGSDFKFTMPIFND